MHIYVAECISISYSDFYKGNLKCSKCKSKWITKIMGQYNNIYMCQDCKHYWEYLVGGKK